MRLQQLEGAIREEHDDVRRLERFGPARLYNKLFGSEERVEREREEYRAAQLRHHECAYAIATGEREVAALEQLIASLGDLDAQYRSIIERKQRLLRQGGGEAAARFFDLSEALAEAQADQRELGEALEAGEAALGCLDTLVETLEEAEEWSITGLAGGSAIAMDSERAALAGAKAEGRDTREALERFARELADVGLTAELSIDVEPFHTTAEFIFGRVYSVVVQTEIRSSLESARSTRKTVKRAVRALRERSEEARRTAERLQQEWQALIDRG